MSNTKVCSKCKVEKDVGEFGKNRSARDGLQVHCRLCRKEYREENRDRINEKGRKYCEANREVLAAKSRAWRVENKSAVAEKRKQQYWDDPETAREKARAWYRENQDRARSACNEWRAANREKVRAYKNEWKDRNRESARASSRGLAKRNMESLVDNYIKSCMRRPDASPELIDKKREQLMAHREARLIAEMFRKRDRGEDTTEIENELMALIERHLELEDKE